MHLETQENATRATSPGNRLIDLVLDPLDMIRSLRREADPGLNIWGPSLLAPQLFGGLYFLDRTEGVVVLVGLFVMLITAGYIRRLGFDATAHTPTATDVDLERALREMPRRESLDVGEHILLEIARGLARRADDQDAHEQREDAGPDAHAEELPAVFDGEGNADLGALLEGVHGLAEEPRGVDHEQAAAQHADGGEVREAHVAPVAGRQNCLVPDAESGPCDLFTIFPETLTESGSGEALADAAGFGRWHGESRISAYSSARITLSHPPSLSRRYSF